ncbi:hypothetical protein SDC9_129026 [bioreactor metagenome]|uniref:Uncharacterized protein n=1 Tax=bioreactor metagenome TaxID=1076179 RepID=A0A645CYN9_9ZZZZ
MVDFVLHRQNVLVVIDQANVAIAGIDKHLLCAEVVRRRVQTDDEMPWKEVLSKCLIIGIRVNEDVSERCGRVADVATAVEQ